MYGARNIWYGYGMYGARNVPVCKRTCWSSSNVYFWHFIISCFVHDQLFISLTFIPSLLTACNRRFNQDMQGATYVRSFIFGFTGEI